MSLQCILTLHVLNMKRLIVPSETYVHSSLAYRDVIPDPDLVGRMQMPPSDDLLLCTQLCNSTLGC